MSLKTEEAKRRTRLSVIIPAYNEESGIAESIARVAAYLDGRPDLGPWELIVVNDGSQDETARIVADLTAQYAQLRLITYPRNKGQGGALRTAFPETRGRVVVVLDADLSYSPDHIGQLVERLTEGASDLVLASAYMTGGSAENVPFVRLLVSRLGNRFLSYALRGKYSTLSCVVRAYRGDVIRSMVLGASGMEINLEIIQVAEILNLEVAEMPAALKWPPERTRNQGRRSWLNLLRTAKVYFSLGFLMRPSIVFKWPAVLFMVACLYFGAIFGYRVAEFSWASAEGLGLFRSLSAGMSMALKTYPQTLVLMGISLLLGLTFGLFAFIGLQIRDVFEKTYRVGLVSVFRQGPKSDYRAEKERRD